MCVLEMNTCMFLKLCLLGSIKCWKFFFLFFLCYQFFLPRHSIKYVYKIRKNKGGLFFPLEIEIFSDITVACWRCYVTIKEDIGVVLTAVLF